MKKPAQKMGSIVDLKTLLAAFGLATVIHLFMVLLFLERASTEIPEFWLFYVANLILWGLGLVPLVAALRGRLAWSDPLFWLSLAVFGSFAGLLVAYLRDSSYILTVYHSLVAYRFGQMSWGEILPVWAQAELIMLIFLALVLLINHRPVSFEARGGSGQTEYRAALLVGVVGLVLGLYGFLRFWAGIDIVRTLLLDTGSINVEVARVRSVTYMSFAVAALPLGLIGLTGLVKNKGSVLLQIVMLAGVVIAVWLKLFTGSRVLVVYQVAIMAVLLWHFGFSYTRRTLLILGTIVVVAVASVTLVRGNRFVAATLADVFEDAFSGQLLDSFVRTRGSGAAPLVDLDRVQTIAFIVENTSHRGDYVLGKSLWAGLGNFLEFLRVRFLGLPADMANRFLEGHDYVNYWRYGTYLTSSIGVGSRPPSYPGEFFMQWGYASLVVLSGLFGLLFRWLRRLIAGTQSLIAKWFVIYMTMLVALYVPAVVGIWVRQLYMPVLPIVVFYLLAYLVVKAGESPRSVARDSVLERNP